jgi:queuosine precursor transporter
MLGDSHRRPTSCGGAERRWNVKSYKYLSFITGIFTATLLISNTLDTKLFSLGYLNLPGGISLGPIGPLPAGIILFPLAYVFGDVLTEVYGYAASRKVIWTGFISLLLMALAYEAARGLPAAPGWEHQGAFDNVLEHTWDIVLASVTAYFVGEICNSYVLAKIKVWMRGRAVPVRLVASTVVGQLADTSVFVLVAYSRRLPSGELLSAILLGWTFKMVWEVLALPLTMFVVSYLKRAEGVDYYDIHTNFNPFHFGRQKEAEHHGAAVSAAP